MKKVVMYTDGACRGNPGPGGWGVWLRYEPHERRLCGGELLTTNNRMELMAVIQGLKTLNESCLVQIYTDSQYVKKGMTEWLASWKKNGWKTSARTPVKNSDLWVALDEVASQHQIQWFWVKGHVGDMGNELADQLANKGIPS
jgi:ribonuclease HI